MTFPADPHDRSPKGDHNRRLALDLELNVFALKAGVTPDELRAYEFTPPDGEFDLAVAQRVGEALEQLEATREPKVDNGPSPLAATEEDPPITAMGTATYRANNA
jgi:hypothetical protein